MLIIQANNIHESGARFLLLGVLKSISALESDLQATVFLDARFDRTLLAGLIDGRRISVRSVNSTVASRLWSEFALARLARRHRGSTVLCLGNIPPLLPCNAKVVLYLQTVLYFKAFGKYLGSLRSRVKLSAERLWIRLRIRSVDLVFVQSQLVGDLLCREFGVDKGSVSVMPFADMENLRAAAPDAPPSARSGFFYPALGTPHKNHTTLIDAWVLLAREGLFPPLLLTIDPRFGELLEYLERAKAEGGIKVANLGVIPHQQVLSQLRSSQAMIFPSLCESLGLPLLEARENGVPVIASERDYVREILNPVETFDPESPRSIARAVKRFLGVGERRMELLAPASLVEHIIR